MVHVDPQPHAHVVDHRTRSPVAIVAVLSDPVAEGVGELFRELGCSLDDEDRRPELDLDRRHAGFSQDGKGHAYAAAIVEPENCAALAEAIGALARDPVRRAAMGDAARAVACRVLRVDDILARAEQRLEELAGVTG